MTRRVSRVPRVFQVLFPFSFSLLFLSFSPSHVLLHASRERFDALRKLREGKSVDTLDGGIIPRAFPFPARCSCNVLTRSEAISR